MINLKWNFFQQHLLQLRRDWLSRTEMEKVETSLVEREAYRAQKLAFEAQAEAFKAQAAYWRKKTESEFPITTNSQNNKDKVFILLMIIFPFFPIFLTNRLISTMFNPLLPKAFFHQNWLKSGKLEGNFSEKLLTLYSL